MSLVAQPYICVYIKFITSYAALKGEDGVIVAEELM